MSSKKNAEENAQKNSEDINLKNKVSSEVHLDPTTPLRVIANKMHITVNELVIAAGTIKLVRDKAIDSSESSTKQTDPDSEIIFDELNEDEFSMRYADNKPR
jgi:hypothetical protein